MSNNSRLAFVVQEIVSIFLGGVKYQEDISPFINLFHLYLWLLLWIVPICLTFTFLEPYHKSYLVAYELAVATVIVLIKVGNHLLHRCLDLGTQKKKERKKKKKKKNESKKKRGNDNKDDDDDDNKDGGFKGTTADVEIELADLTFFGMDPKDNNNIQQINDEEKPSSRTGKRNSRSMMPTSGNSTPSDYSRSSQDTGAGIIATRDRAELYKDDDDDDECKNKEDKKNYKEVWIEMQCVHLKRVKSLPIKEEEDEYEEEDDVEEDDIDGYKYMKLRRHATFPLDKHSFALEDNNSNNNEEEKEEKKDNADQLLTYIDEYGDTQSYFISNNDDATPPDTNTIPPIVAPNQRSRRMSADVLMDVIEEEEDRQPPQPQPPMYDPNRNLVVVGPWVFPLPFGRHSVESVFDKSQSFKQVFFYCLCAFSTSVMAFSLVHWYKEGQVVMFWISVAAAQFSLFKAPSRDASSPHVESQISTGSSRAVYFCIGGCIALILDLISTHIPGNNLLLYGRIVNFQSLTANARDITLTAVMISPIFSLVGWYPKVSTLCLHIMELGHMGLMGGCALHSLPSALIEVIIDLVVIVILSAILMLDVPLGAESASWFFAVFAALCLALPCYLASPSHSLQSFGRNIWIRLQRRYKKSQQTVITPTIAETTPEKFSISTLIQSWNIKRRGFAIFVLLRPLLFAVGLLLFEISQVLHAHRYEISCTGAAMTIVITFATSSVIPRLRSAYPFCIFQEPLLDMSTAAAAAPTSKSTKHNHHHNKSKGEAVLVFSRVIVAFVCIPMFFLPYLFDAAANLDSKFGPWTASVICILSCVKAMRWALTANPILWQPFLFMMLFLKFDLNGASEGVALDFLLASIICSRLNEFVDKSSFVLRYSAPWNMGWGSAVHAITQPLSLPHTTLLIAQVLLSCIISAPIMPVGGSSWFICGGPRPIKFWGKVDHVTALQDAGFKEDDKDDEIVGVNRLSRVFFEHMATSLSRSLASDIQAGRFGPVADGEVLLLTNDSQTAIIHILDCSETMCRYYLRGIEQKGTYCQERELESIHQQRTQENEFFAGDFRGYLPKLLSIEDAHSLHWNTWKVANNCVSVETYDVMVNRAGSLISSFSMRVILIRRWIEAAVYFLCSSADVDSWISNPMVTRAIESIGTCVRDNGCSRQPDYDYDSNGITYNSFKLTFGSWVEYCWLHRNEERDYEHILPLAFAVSIIGRQWLLLPSGLLMHPEKLWRRIRKLMKSNVKSLDIMLPRPLVRQVFTEAAKYCIPLFMDYFSDPDEYADLQALFRALKDYNQNTIIATETEPAWRAAILDNAPKLMTIRELVDDTCHDRKVHATVSVVLRECHYRVVNVGKDVARALWATQIHEISFLGNQNQERGSIQQMRPCLRNILSQQPIYISPIMTSFVQ